MLKNKTNNKLARITGGLKVECRLINLITKLISFHSEKNFCKQLFGITIIT